MHVESRKWKSYLILQSRYRDTDVENICMDTKGAKGGRRN